MAALLLNADGVAHIADTQPLGWQRNAARTTVRPFQALSHALLLNRPRAWLAEATGAPQLLDAGRDPKAAPTTTTVPGATTTTLPPLQVRTPTSDAPLLPGRRRPGAQRHRRHRSTLGHHHRRQARHRPQPA
jgi:hypothetical protein